MNISLQFRPVKTRLMVAYMADAINGGFEPCEPGNTWTRLADTIVESFNNECATVHPYSTMWETIDSFYDSRRMYELSDDEIADMYTVAISNGIDGKCTGMDVMRAKQRWETNCWTRYEQRRNGRRQTAVRLAVPAMACFGIVLPGE